jgi:hypothetical protein
MVICGMHYILLPTGMPLDFFQIQDLVLYLDPVGLRSS